MNSLLCGVRIAAERLKSPSTVVISLLSILLVCLSALLERRSDVSLAPDRTLQGAVFGLIIPLLCYAAIARVTTRQRWSDSLVNVALHGADRRLAIFGATLSIGACLSLAGAILAVVGAVSAHGPTSGRLTADLIASSWIGAAAAAAYTTLFSLAANFGQAGQGRLWVLLIDYVVGSGTSLLALPWPRGHLRNLLGGEPVLGFSQRAAFWTVTLLIATYMSLAVSRSER